MAAGCFGDWVRARNRPRREAPVAASGSTGEAAPAEPCSAYLAAVAEHCDEILDGHPHARGCHGEVVRVMGLFREGEQPRAHRPDRAPGETRDQACARFLRAMPEERGAPPAPVELGPSCAAWAKEIRERCVAPLAGMPPALDECGPDLAAFEGVLGGMTFGHAEDYEGLCHDAAEKLRAEP